MNVPTPVRPRLTTLWGGAGIVVASLLSLLAFFRFSFPLTHDYFLVFSAPIPAAVSAVILLVAIGILAFGIPGESGIVGHSVVGKVALLVFGIRDPVRLLVSSLSKGRSIDAIVAVGRFEFAFEFVVLAAIVVAAVVVVRADVLHGFARWALVPVAVCDVIIMGLSFIPVLALVPVANGVGLLRLVSLVALGIGYLLEGRSAAIRHRLQIINERW